MAHTPSRACYCREKCFRIVCLLGHIDIADALTGERQRLGVGIAHNGVLINGGNKGDFCAVVAQLPIRLIGDNVDGMTELLALFCQQRAQCGEGLAAVDCACRIIGGVYNDGLSVFGDGVGQRIQSNLEIRHIGATALKVRPALSTKGRYSGK